MATAELLEQSQRAYDDEPQYEVIDGIKVELPPMSTLASIVTNKLANSLEIYGRGHKSGTAYMESLIRLPIRRNRQRRPDVMFVTFDRWPVDRPILATQSAWEVVPDVAIEVVSPSDLAEEIFEKMQEYFESGVRSVWIVYPRIRLIHVFDNMTTMRGFTVHDVLDGGSVLPGYRQPVAALFPPTIDPPAASDA